MKLDDLKSLRILRLVALLIGALTSGCGIGLCVGEGVCQGVASSPRLLLSGLEGLSIRKNDCYPITLSALDAAGNPMTQVNATVTLTASSGVVLYSTLQGCQKYDISFEQSVFVLIPATPKVLFYFRSDVDGGVSISASTDSNQSGLASTTQPVSVTFSAFDNSEGASALVQALVYTGTGEAYLGGAFETYNDLRVGYVARLTASGSFDTGFRPVGDGLNGQVHGLALQSDGRLLVAGEFTAYSGTSRPYIARLNSDGSLDNTFAPTGTGLNDFVHAIAVQLDGRLLVAGDFTDYNGTSRSRVARLLADGTLDTTFAQTGTGFNFDASQLYLQPDGKVLVTGYFTSYHLTSRSYIARLNSDGTLDGTFAQTGSGLNSWITSLAVQSDGKAIVGGFFGSYNGTAISRIARIAANGSLDTTFSQSGSGIDVSPQEIAIQSDGQVLVVGAFSNYNGTSRPSLARLNPNGSLDTNFAPSGTGLSGTAYSVYPQSNGKILVGGDFLSYNGTAKPRVAQLNSDGGLDAPFGPEASGFNQELYALAQQADGKILAGGRFTRVAGASKKYLVRLKTDGTIDSDFTQAGTGFNSEVTAIKIQNDGKILVGGSFTGYNGTSQNYLSRLLPDGTLDPTFALAGTGLNGSVYALAVQADGKIVVGGWFTAYNAIPRASIARLNSDGSLDNTFAQTGAGLDSLIYSLVLQPDGKFLVGGSFTNYSGTSSPYVARINSDGTLDGTFAPTGSGIDNEVLVLQLQTDGKVLVAGRFSQYNGSAAPYIIRLNSDGSPDSMFLQSGTGLDNDVAGMALQSDGKILVGGDFTVYNGTARGHVARLNPDGSLDTTFLSSSTGFDDYINVIFFQSNGKIVAGGNFHRFGASTADYLSRLTYIGTLD